MDKNTLLDIYGDMNFLYGYLKQWKKTEENEFTKEKLEQVTKRLNHSIEKLKKVM